jgi:hypothetical protein
MFYIVYVAKKWRLTKNATKNAKCEPCTKTPRTSITPRNQYKRYFPKECIRQYSENVICRPIFL